MTPTNQPFEDVRRLSLSLKFSVGMTLGIMVLGSLVRSTDSGLSCPDWPLCFDKVVPVFDIHIFLEWFHRFLVAVLSGVLLYSGWKMFRLRKVLSSVILPAAIALFVLFTVQVVLGGLTVLKLLQPSVVSIHLLNAVLFLGVLSWTHFRISDWFAVKSETPLVDARDTYTRLWPRIFTVLVFIQIAFGGSIATSGSATICSDFPLCYGQFWPEAVGMAQVQMLHRYIAFAMLIGAALFASLSRGMSSKNHLLAWAMTVLIALQIVLGIANIFYSAPPWASSLHLANALALFYISLVLGWGPTQEIVRSKLTANSHSTQRQERPLAHG